MFPATCLNPTCQHTFSTDVESVLCPKCNGTAIVRIDAVATLQVPEARGLSSTLTVDSPMTQETVDQTILPQIGRFQVRAKLGAGAFGDVYRAHDPQLDREVALKVAKPGTLDSPERIGRFLREARAAANLRHPNIVPVHDSGQDGDRHYIATGFIYGRTLEAEIDEAIDKPHDLKRAVSVVRKLAEALRYAHKQGVVHRDVKPANVLVDAAGEPSLTDFGLAVRAGDEAVKTQDGRVMGTPAYMSPEQAAGKSADATSASDQYALGIMLYEMTTGVRPFVGAMDVVIFQQIQVQPKRPRAVNRAIPKDLETVILKCLEKDPTKRYASCEALAADLRRFLDGEPVTARRIGPLERTARWAKRNPVVAGSLAFAFLVLVAGTAVSLWQRDEARAAAASEVEQKKLAEENERKAKNEAEKSDRATEYLVSIFKLADATGTRSTTPRQILDAAEMDIPKQFAGQPELRDNLLRRIGALYDQMTANTPLAMLLESRGTVQLHSSRDPSRRVVPQMLLYTDDRLSLGADGHVRLLILSDLHQEWLREGAEATVRRKGCEPKEFIEGRDQNLLMTFVPMRKGTFHMGWDGTIGSAKKTEILEEFELAAHDVTQSQWVAIMGENPSIFSRFGSRQNQVRDFSDEELKLFPVENVSWNDCQAFLKKLNEKESGRGYLYRLPSAAEWEYCCRNGSTSEADCSYHYYLDKPTNDLSSKQANFDGSFPFAKMEKGPYLKVPTRVGAYPPNKLGLCDMHGNVRQWCADLYVYDPNTPEAVSNRVNKGCSFNGTGYDCQAARRHDDTPDTRIGNLGLRLARVRQAALDK